MIFNSPTHEMVDEWKLIWNEYKDLLHANRKSGQDLIDYLYKNYILTEIFEKNTLECVKYNVNMNETYSEKLPNGVIPVPRAFYLENKGKGDIFYKAENQDSNDLWGGKIERIFVGIDISSGFFMVEGSVMLCDELRAFQGLDETDINNICIVSDYINCLKKFNMLQKVLGNED